MENKNFIVGILFAIILGCVAIICSLITTLNDLKICSCDEQKITISRGIESQLY